MAIWLPRLAIERWQHVEQKGTGGDALDRSAPVALIEEAAHGPRIIAANGAGIAAGAWPGRRLTDARTLCPGLKIVTGDSGGDLAFLGRLAVWAQRWGPRTALDAPDGVLVDTGGVAHLFGDEEQLLTDAQHCLARQGLTARLAVAPTVGAAWALARYGPERTVLTNPAVRSHASALPPCHDGHECINEALAGLPVAALRLDDEVLLVLRRLGLKRIGDLAKIRRDALRRRFRQPTPGLNPLVRLDQLLGRAPEPLLPVVAEKLAAVQRRLPEPIRHREWLECVVGDLAGDMARELETRGEGARRLELGLWRVDGDIVLHCVELAVATRDPAHIARLFGARLGAIDAGFGIELVRLRAVWTEPLTLGQVALDTRAERGSISLAECLDQLSVRLGARAIRRPAVHASHIPERAQYWKAPLETLNSLQVSFASWGRPLKLLDYPEKIVVLYATPDGAPRRFRWRGQVHEIVRAEGPERIAPEWWREKGSTRLRDYYRIEDSDGRRYWIYRAGLVGDGRGDFPDWFLQGTYG